MNGVLLINKPKDYTSHDIVAIVKKIYKEKVGHTGTLDPNATGVLPLLVGKATLISKYLMNHDKKYIAVLKLGTKTTTADGEGEIIEEKEVSKLAFLKENIEKVFEGLVGKNEQIPPIYSAIKIKGKKLYEYARAGQEVLVQPRVIEIYSLNILEINEESREIKFEVACSKGTYIRSLCESIAEKLETVGYMKDLQRIEVGNFNINQAIELKRIQENKDNLEFLAGSLISIEEIFKEKKYISVCDKRLGMFLNGVKLPIMMPNSVYRIYNKNKFIGLGIVNNNQLKRDVII